MEEQNLSLDVILVWSFLGRPFSINWDMVGSGGENVPLNFFFFFHVCVPFYLVPEEGRPFPNKILAFPYRETLLRGLYKHQVCFLLCAWVEENMTQQEIQKFCLGEPSFGR